MSSVLLEESLSYPLPTQRSRVARIASHVAVRWSRSLGVLVVDCDAHHINGCERADDDGGPCTCSPSFPAGRRSVEDVRDETRANVVRLAVEHADSWRAEVRAAVEKLSASAQEVTHDA